MPKTKRRKKQHWKAANEKRKHMFRLREAQNGDFGATTEGEDDAKAIRAVESRGV